jgi:hypothetical protein
MPLHPDFKLCAWRGTTSTKGEVIGISFNMPDGGIVRLALPLWDAVRVTESIQQILNAYLLRSNSLPSGSEDGLSREEVLLEMLSIYRMCNNSQSSSSEGSSNREGSPQEGQSE